MAEQRRVHPVVHHRGLARVEAEQRGRELVQRRARTRAVRREVRGPERARLAESFDAVVGCDADDGRRKRVDHAAAGHHVAPVDVREVVAVDVDTGDLHVSNACG